MSLLGLVWVVGDTRCCGCSLVSRLGLATRVGEATDNLGTGRDLRSLSEALLCTLALEEAWSLPPSFSCPPRLVLGLCLCSKAIWWILVRALSLAALCGRLGRLMLTYAR